MKGESGEYTLQANNGQVVTADGVIKARQVPEQRISHLAKYIKRELDFPS